MNVFQVAAKKKYRFESPRGLLTAEDLFDLKLDMLDGMAVALDKATTDGAPKSFLSGTMGGARKSAEYEVQINKLEIIKAVIASKETDRDAAATARDNQVKRTRILEIMAEKQDGALQEKSLEELQKLLDEAV